MLSFEIQLMYLNHGSLWILHPVRNMVNALLRILRESFTYPGKYVFVLTFFASFHV
jgi:hypothetical protein